MSEVMPTRAELDRAFASLMGERQGPEARDCLTWASEIAPEKVRWLWTGRIPAGTLSVFDGDPGKGKSTVTAELAAAVSTGRPLPGDTAMEAGTVLFVSLEDDPATVIIPRLEAAEADRSKVAIFEIPVGNGLTRMPVLPDDLDLLRQNVIRAEAKLVIIDPLLAVLSAEVNSDKGQDMGRVLAELVLLAKQTGAAVVVVRHLNKSVGKAAIYRGTGSTGIIGTARSGLVLTEHPGRPGELLLAGFKSNNGVRPKSLALRIESAANGAGRIVWGAECEISADDALNGTAPGQEDAERSDAEQWLLELLKDGSVPASQIFKDAEECGFTREQIKRAKSKLGVGARRTTGADSHWRWELPEKKGVSGQEGTPLTPLTPFPPLADSETGQQDETSSAAQKERKNIQTSSLNEGDDAEKNGKGGKSGKGGKGGDTHAHGDAPLPCSAEPPEDAASLPEPIPISSAPSYQPPAQEAASRSASPTPNAQRPATQNLIPWPGRDLIDLESWPGPWCPHCTSEPVRQEEDLCPGCRTEVQRTSERWRA